MVGVTCMKGRGERCGAQLVAVNDDRLVEVYLAHLRDAHRDLDSTEQQVRDDLLIQGYEVVSPASVSPASEGSGQ